MDTKLFKPEDDVRPIVEIGRVGADAVPLALLT